MKKILFSLLLFGQVAFAQQLRIQTITFVKASEAGGYYYPVFSPAGDYLLTTSENYSGLKQYSISKNTVKTLTAEPGAGYGVQISSDGTSIVYKKTEYVKNLRHTSLHSYSLTTATKVQLVAPTREAIASRFSANKAQYVKGKTFVRNNVSVVAPIIVIEDQKMVLYSASQRKVITPNGKGASYIWPSLSPDMKKIAYTVAGKGTFVCDINGQNPISLGKINAPVWVNNDWIVGMDDKDDGEKLLSSVLVAAAINGKVKQTLNTPIGKPAMYPAVSADGLRIAFNTDKGELYLMNILIK